MNAIGSGLSGLARSTQQLNAAHQRISNGEIDAEPIVASKEAEIGIKANLISIQSSLDTQKYALDILA